MPTGTKKFALTLLTMWAVLVLLATYLLMTAFNQSFSKAAFNGCLAAFLVVGMLHAHMKGKASDLLRFFVLTAVPFAMLERLFHRSFGSNEMNSIYALLGLTAIQVILFFAFPRWRQWLLRQ